MPTINEEGQIHSGDPISEASVRANMDALLAPLSVSPQDCGVYRSVLTGLEGYYGTSFAGIAGEYALQADRMHRRGMGDLWEHFPGCPLS